VVGGVTIARAFSKEEKVPSRTMITEWIRNLDLREFVILGAWREFQRPNLVIHNQPFG
jgi:hypothetical protein